MENGQNKKGPRKRRKLSGGKKYQVLEELKHNPGKKTEILRREGLYRADIQRYEEISRVASISALGKMRPGKKRPQEVPVEEYDALKRINTEQEKALAAMAIEFLALKKKVNGE